MGFGQQKSEPLGSLFLAEWTGLEPATPGVTGRYSNQLNYHSKNLFSVVCFLTCYTTLW